MKNFNSAVSESSKDEWLTPPYIVEALGPFDLDPCAPSNPPWRTAARHISLPDDGLTAPWSGRVWLNPPYGRETFRWMDRLAEHKSGIALIFARTETLGFHETIWEKAHSLFFFKRRLCFYHVDGTQGDAANAPSVLVSYSAEDTDILDLAQWQLSGKLVRL